MTKIHLTWIHVDHLSFYSQRQLVLKITTLYRFQKLINKGNTQVNGSLLNFAYFCEFCPHSCPRSCLCVLFIQCKMQVFKITVNVVSWFGKEQNSLVSQSKPFDTIVRHIVEISEHDVMTYHKNLTPIAHEQRLWNSLSLSGISNPRPGLTPGTALRAVGSEIIPHVKFVYKWKSSLFNLYQVYENGHSILFRKTFLFITNKKK